MIDRLDAHHDPDVVWNVLGGARGDLAFDVGVNIGQSTKVLAKGFTRVIAFEPHPDSYIIMKDEMPANVIPVQTAVSAFNGRLSLDVASYSITTGQYVTGEGLYWGDLLDKVEVDAVTLDSALQVYGVPDFVKIDTEGHEVEVVRGAQKVFSYHPQTVIEIHKAENEKLVRQLLPDYEWTKMEHSLRVASFARQNHFWLVSQ